MSNQTKRVLDKETLEHVNLILLELTMDEMEEMAKKAIAAQEELDTSMKEYYVSKADEHQLKVNYILEIGEKLKNRIS